MTLKEMRLVTPTKRRLAFLTGDLILFSTAFVAAFLIRFEFRLPPYFQIETVRWFPLAILTQILLLWHFGLYRCSWSFVGLKELAGILKAGLCWTALLFASLQTAQWLGIPNLPPRSIALLHGLLSMLFVGAFRIAKRIWREVLQERRTGQRTLFIGAGPTGERLSREMLRDPESAYCPVAFVDDDPSKAKTFIHGVPVAGVLADIPAVVRQYQVKAAVMAITSAKHVLVQRLWNTLRQAGILTLKVVPPFERLPEESLSLRHLRDLNIEDLLYRDPVDTDQTAIQGFLMGRRVLVTGAAGSIGSEITRQVLRHAPAALIILDIDETGVHDRLAELRRLAPAETALVPFIGDVRSPRSMASVFETHHPQVVFHAAAYKHVPLMEQFPGEALQTNIAGTYALARAAQAHQVERFVNISTDKAVNPTSVMGATKRLSETVCSALNGMNGCRYMSVRFGNVLGSRGSVVPLFLDQIRQGGPVTVTHPEMRRYFMTIPEAVNLVFQAASMGRGGEVFVLDMGEPVKILTLAEDLIRLNGMEPYNDIPIAFTGIRPGEKLFEEILTAEEGTATTAHAKVFVARQSPPLDNDGLKGLLGRMGEAIDGGDDSIRVFLRKNVPFFRPKP